MLSCFRHKPCACAGRQEPYLSAHQLNSAAKPYMPAGLSGYGKQKPAAAQQSYMLSTFEGQVGSLQPRNLAFRL